MTDRQLRQKQAELNAEMNSKGFGWINGKYIQPPEEYRLREKELGCINMINSILAYGGFGLDAETVMEHEEKAYHNYLAQYVNILGRERVVELIQGQIDSIKGINRNVATDSEGCSYNSIVWNE